jgi:hypothetical protein
LVSTFGQNQLRVQKSTKESIYEQALMKNIEPKFWNHFCILEFRVLLKKQGKMGSYALNQKLTGEGAHVCNSFYLPCVLV